MAEKDIKTQIDLIEIPSQHIKKDYYYLTFRNTSNNKKSLPISMLPDKSEYQYKHVAQWTVYESIEEIVTTFDSLRKKSFPEIRTLRTTLGLPNALTDTQDTAVKELSVNQSLNNIASYTLIEDLVRKTLLEKDVKQTISNYAPVNN